MWNMKNNLSAWSLYLLLLAISYSEAGSKCPTPKELYPCFCTRLSDGGTLHVCQGIQNTAHLEQVTKPLKSMIIERFMLLDVFANEDVPLESENEIKPRSGSNRSLTFGMLPKKWLSAVRIRELEIQGGHLNNCFLCDDALEGQSDFLTSIVAKNANLGGHVCSTCALGSAASSLSTRELRRTPFVKTVDLSHNNIEVVDGLAFPSEMRQLTKIDMSNNKINKIYDKAFSNLQQLTELDLSNNELSTISSKIFRPRDESLKILDLSYNVIQTIKNDTFINLIALKEIRLSHNILQTLPEHTWSKIPSLMERIDLRGNFLVCNCTMKWIERKLSRSTKVIGHCVAPKEVEFQELRSNLASLASCR